jgi:ubiquinone/menaquinone biosynthesis C-methylase UbiE
LADGIRLSARRSRGRTTEFNRQARELLDELPRYYRRNFHFQTDGYLSERSAALYEHQVEMLFRGTADAMRRLILPPLKKHFGGSDGKGLRLLEVGAGTGRTTRFVRLAVPKARIIAMDMSESYLRHASRSLAHSQRVDFLQGDGGVLPFKDGEFDGIYSVFLFHELPRQAREQSLAEARRVLKPGGFFGFVDSVQKGDKAGFDPLLTHFPVEFHEPYYRDYLEHSMEGLIRSAGFEGLEQGTGFLSKWVAARRPLSAKP